MENHTETAPFSPFTPSSNDFSCKNGEIEASNAWFDHTGAVAPAPSLEACSPSTPGEVKAMLGDNRIFSMKGDVYWSHDPARFQAIAEGRTIRTVSMLGPDSLVICTEIGMIHVYLDAFENIRMKSYVVKMPDLEFGMVKKGSLTCGEIIEADSSVLAPASSQQGGSGASNPHPSASLSAASSESDKVAKAVLDAFRRAHAEQVEARGLFSSPFFVRYGLRLTNGQYLRVSPPVLMLPNILPPCIGLCDISAVDDKKSRATVDLSANSSFELCFRQTSFLDEDWAHLIAGIDIFVSKPVSTFDDSYLAASTSDVADLFSGISDGSHNRGRDAAAASEIFAGHYSLDGTTFTDQFIPLSVAGRVWRVKPNPTLCADITAPQDFYRIATIPNRGAVPSQVMTKVEIESTAPEAISHCPILDVDETVSLDLVPDVVYTASQSLIAADGFRRLPAPAPLRTVTPVTGSTSGEPDSECEVSVYVRHESGVYAARSSSPWYSVPLAESFPRMVYYPDPDAFMMQIRTSGATWQLPLVPHADGVGAYWFGGLDARHAPRPIGTASGVYNPPDVSDLVPCRGVIHFSPPSCPYVFRPRSTIRVGHGSVVALASALSTPSEATIGRFPVYAFTSAGVYMLEYSAEQQCFVGGSLISEERCIRPESVAPVGSGVVFMTSRLMYVEGSKVTCLYDGGGTGNFRLDSLPHIRQLPMAEALEGARQPDLTRCGCVYDADFDALVIYDAVDHGEYAWLYSMRARCLTPIKAQVANSVVSSRGGACLCDTSGRLLRLSAPDEPTEVALVTRPVKLSKTFSPCRLLRCSILAHCRSPKINTAVYGSISGFGRWHLVNSSATGHVEVCDAERFSALRLAVTATLSPGDYIYGARIDSA